MLIGVVFIASALMKYLSIDAVDMFVFEHKLFSWDFTQVITRLLIGIEAGLGLALVVGLCQKYLRWLSIGFLTGFTLYVLLKPVLFEVSEDNCHCFGTVILLSDGETIIKNIILLALSYFTFWQEGIKRKWGKWICIALFVASTATIFTIKAPDFVIYALYDKSASLDMEKFEKLLDDSRVKELNVRDGKKILCLYSTGCRHCKRSAMKLDIIRQRHNLNKQDFAVVFWGKEANIEKFYSETNTEKLPTTFVSPQLFLPATKGRQPIIVLLDNGKVVDLFKSITIDEDKIVSFLK